MRVLKLDTTIPREAHVALTHLANQYRREYRNFYFEGRLDSAEFSVEARDNERIIFPFNILKDLYQRYREKSLLDKFILDVKRMGKRLDYVC